MSEKSLTKRKAWYRLTAQSVLEVLDSSAKGLSQEEVERRSKEFGSNEIPKTVGRAWWQIVWGQFKSPLIYILVVAAIVSFSLGHMIDFWVIIGVIILNGFIGFIQEFKAERSTAALESMIVSKTRVIRQGEIFEVPTAELVPGDIVSLEGGDQVPADARVIDVHNCQVVESSLTGESKAVRKIIEPIDRKAAMADQVNMVWGGTYVASGNLRAVVTAIGARTVLGRIASSLQETDTTDSHFQRLANTLARKMGAMAGLGALLIFLVGLVLLREELKVGEVFVFALALLVSSIPEGLPAVLTIVLAVGARRMAGQSVITKHLPAIESIGIVDAIATDKTGTLTQNTMTVEEVFLARDEAIKVTGQGWQTEGEFRSTEGGVIEAASDSNLNKLLEIGVWGTGARLIKEAGPPEKLKIVGEPTEAALVVLGAKGGIEKNAQTAEGKKIRDVPFDQLARYRAALVNSKSTDGEPTGRELYVVGSPDRLLELSSSFQAHNECQSLDEARRRLIETSIEEMGGKGLRVIALAYKPLPAETERFSDDQVNDLVFVGVVGMKDPARPGVADSIAKARQAGIRILMCTGDHKKTALAIAEEVGLITAEDLTDRKLEDLGYSQTDLESMNEEDFSDAVRDSSVFARVTPDMKKRIAMELQSQGHLIAMTGDGVNDVPALSQADVGIAMGKVGTDLARESSDIVLADDNFVSIVSAIEEGRNIFRNVRNTSGFLVTTSVAENFTIITSLAVAATLPLQPTQILWLNLVTDGVTDVSLALEPKRHDVMAERPRSQKEHILSKRVLTFIIFIGLIMTGLAVGTLFYFLEQGTAKAQTAVFTFLAFAQLFNVLNMRSLTQSIWTIGLWTNKYVILAITFSALAQFVVLQIEGLQNLFGFETLSILEMSVLIVLAGIILIAGELYKLIYRRFIGLVG